MTKFTKKSIRILISTYKLEGNKTAQRTTHFSVDFHGQFELHVIKQQFFLIFSTIKQFTTSLIGFSLNEKEKFYGQKENSFISI